MDAINKSQLTLNITLGYSICWSFEEHLFEIIKIQLLGIQKAVMIKDIIWITLMLIWVEPTGFRLAARIVYHNTAHFLAI